MGAMASQISSLTIVYSNVYSGTDQRKHQSSASLAFERGILLWPVNSPHKWSVTRKMFPSDDVIMVGWWRGRKGWMNTCIRRDHSVYGLSQWETMLLCNAVSHWLNPYTERSLICGCVLVCMLTIFRKSPCSWRRHNIETLSVLLALCGGNLTSHPHKGPMMQTFYISLDVRKQSNGWWYEKLRRSHDVTSMLADAQEPSWYTREIYEIVG